jgi:hypothetical protein
MACNFSISFPGPAENLLEKAKAAIEGQGGNFAGDLSSGNFSVQVLGSISGSYTITGQVMNINISSKPLFISCNQIESFMKSRFQ